MADGGTWGLGDLETWGRGDFNLKSLCELDIIAHLAFIYLQCLNVCRCIVILNPVLIRHLKLYEVRGHKGLARM